MLPIRSKRNEEQLREVYAREEVMQRQRSRVDWLAAGDMNTKYFQGRASHRKRKNTVRALIRDDGSKCIDRIVSYTTRLVGYGNHHAYVHGGRKPCSSESRLEASSLPRFGSLLPLVKKCPGAGIRDLSLLHREIKMTYKYTLAQRIS